MVDLDILEAKGCSKGELKKKFSTEKPSKEIENLNNLLKSRLAEGWSHNLSNYRIFHALDTAWDLPLKQVTATMLQSLIDSNLDDTQMMDSLAAWGADIRDIVTEYPDPKDPRRTLKKFNMPAFYRIFVPLVRSYVTIRRAKMMNDRKLVPFMKFEPSESTELTRMRAEIITSRGEVMANDYGFWDIEDQACWRMLHYGVCCRFMTEEWHKEEQLVEWDSPYEGEGEGEVVGDGDDAHKKWKRVCMKEGLRYHMPHPTRSFYDMAWPAHTLNTDCGASYAGYWRVMRYGDIMAKKDFFNLSRIKKGGSAADFFHKNQTGFFKNVYPCTMKFPTGLENAGGEFDTENRVADSIYVTEDHDKGLILTEMFCKLVPDEWGLGEYDCPVWFRFVMANDDTVVYAAPLPYSNPVLYDGYDPVSGRTLNPSMSLEILPFQDHFANLLSQYLLSTKQNLVNMTLVDSDVVDEKDIEDIERFPQKIWSALKFIRFSSRKFFKSQQQPVAVLPQKFPQTDTGQIERAMRTILEILERVLVMSAQELGQAASHEQTREEVRNIASNTSTRAQFTASSLDRSRQAWKKQIFEGLMAYGSEAGYAQVPAAPELGDPEKGPELLSKLGFTYEGYDKEKKLLRVGWTKTAIRYASFAANRDGDDRINEVELAQAQSAFMQQLGANPMIAQAIGPDQFIAMANMIAKSAGFARDFRLVNRGPDVTPEEQSQQIIQQVQQMVEQSIGQFAQETQGALKEIIDENTKQSSEIAQVMEAIGMISQANQPQPQQQMPPQEPLPGEMPPGM